MGRAAPLTSRRCIVHIYSTNIRTEYFKHAAHSLFFPLQNAVCFIMLPFFCSCIIHILHTGCAKIKKKTKFRRQSVKQRLSALPPPSLPDCAVTYTGRLQCELNITQGVLYVISQGMAAVSHRNPASTELSHHSSCVPGLDKWDAIQLGIRKSGRDGRWRVEPGSVVPIYEGVLISS